MELREFGERVLLSESLADKLASVHELLTDNRPGQPLRIESPARPAGLQIAEKRAHRMPRTEGFALPHCRAVAHHIMANHELQALEMMAWLLLAFPDAPTDFRAGLANVMRDEQRHTQMHIRRIEAHGMQFGDVRVNGHVWRKTASIRSLLDYIACLPLTFEGGNLDHTIEFAERFDRVGEERSAAVMRAIHDDEVEHVAFGVTWLRRLKPAGQSDWSTYSEHVHWPLTTSYARGKVLQRDARLRAGMDVEFLSHLEGITEPSK